MRHCGRLNPYAQCFTPVLELIIHVLCHMTLPFLPEFFRLANVKVGHLTYFGQ